MIHIVPAPNGPVSVKDTYLHLPETIGVEYGGFASWCVSAFLERTGRTTADQAPWLRLQKDTACTLEEYHLQVNEEGITIRAAGEAGVVWALASVYQLIRNDSIPLCQISDRPKFEYRGMHLDCARHFFSVQTVKQVIDHGSLAKLNVLHWHLSDDQAWRIESQAFPKLHETSGEYYTHQQIREIVEYARIRGMEIIPEIDVPGHTTGILAAYPEYGCFGKEVQLATTGGIFPIILCTGKEETFAFLEKIYDEVCPLFPSKWFHVGGDEAPKSEWAQCPDCRKRMEEQGLASTEDLQGYFTIRIGQMLKKHGKEIICWNDTLKSSVLPEDVLIQYWTLQYEEQTKQYVSRGGKYFYAEMFDCYLDYPHSMIPLKKVYGSTPKIGKIVCAPENGLVGLEACLWTEHIITPEQLGKRLFPRIFALAEKAWSEKLNYSGFKKRIAPLLRSLEKAGIAYTPENWWDPKGKARREEGLAYMEKMFAGIADALPEEATEGMSANPGFLLGFLTKFFRITDLPYLLKVLKR